MGPALLQSHANSGDGMTEKLPTITVSDDVDLSLWVWFCRLANVLCKLFSKIGRFGTRCKLEHFIRISALKNYHYTKQG